MAWPYTREEPSGEFRDEWKPTKAENPEFRDRTCGSDDVWYRTWDSADGAWTDYQYHCRACGRKWWVEGSDS